MALKIRLARGGKKGNPVYRIVVANSTSPRDGKFIENVGTYSPLLAEVTQRCTVKADRISYWVSVGAKPTERVVKLISNFKECAEVSQKFPISTTKNRKPKKEAVS